MRLIDADALMGMDIKIGYIGEKTVRAIQRATVDAIYRNIGNSPTVDAVPVRHGEWIESDYEYTRCSNCNICIDWQYLDGVSVNGMDMPYCPNCGAKMNG